ncbi:MAG: hypothetical protein QNJ17_12900 [Desulfocapsaceae bacterium]|nr:hypothetical protein [Desulfocapsaceae bacterium]
MLGNSWSIALLICSAGALFLIVLASITALKILVRWDEGSDSEEQIDLEGRTWLAAALVESGLTIQVISLFLLVAAAGDFAGMIAGAMCATGSFLANEYGPISLYLKIAGLFLYGFWIVLHRLDLRSEYFPLVRIKFIYLILLLPFLIVDSYYLVGYLYNLDPDIITSCCGVVFADQKVRTNFMVFSMSSEGVAAFFYLLGILVLFMGVLSLNSCRETGQPAFSLSFSYGFLWFVFFVLALIGITVFFSSYIYAMPHHNCPFDILHREYGYIGVPIYIALFGGAFLGMSNSVAALFRNKPGLSVPVAYYQRLATKSSILLLLLFVSLVSFPVLRYFLAGGEV